MKYYSIIPKSLSVPTNHHQTTISEQKKPPHSSLAAEAFSAKVAPKTDLKTATGNTFILHYKTVYTQFAILRTIHGNRALAPLRETFPQQKKHADSSPKTTLKPATGKAFHFYIACHGEPEPALILPKSRTMIGVKYQLATGLHNVGIPTLCAGLFRSRAKGVRGMSYAIQEKPPHSSPKTALKPATGNAFILHYKTVYTQFAILRTIHGNRALAPLRETFPQQKKHPTPPPKQP